MANLIFCGRRQSFSEVDGLDGVGPQELLLAVQLVVDVVDGIFEDLEFLVVQKDRPDPIRYFRSDPTRQLRSETRLDAQTVLHCLR